MEPRIRTIYECLRCNHRYTHPKNVVEMILDITNVLFVEHLSMREHQEDLNRFGYQMV